MAIAPSCRHAHDAKTAEAAIYYFRQDFPAALKLFQEVLTQTKDWDQVKYCSYWLKEIKRKMSFAQSESFACGPKALEIVLNRLGLKQKPGQLRQLFKSKTSQVSLLELTQVAKLKGLKPKVAKVATADLENLNKPFIALVEPEHYIVVTQTRQGTITFLDPQSEKEPQTSTLEEFSRYFKGYALIFLEDTQLASYPVPLEAELESLKGGVCWCCPPGGLGQTPNTEYDGQSPCSVGMPSFRVNLTNLNFLIQDIDFAYTSKGMPIEFIRTYNADDPREGPLGRSWTFNYNLGLTENPDSSIDIRQGDGRIDHFFWNGTRYQPSTLIYEALSKNPDNTYTLRVKADKTTYNFNSQGRLTQIQDRNQNTIAFTYDAQGNLITITDPNNKNTSLSYNAANLISRITLPDNRSISFSYDANNNLIQSTDMLGATSSFSYDSASYITAITTPHQGTTTIQYTTDPLEGYAIKSITDSLGNKRSYSVEQTHYDVSVTDSQNHSTLYSNDYTGYTQSITTATGNKITFGYDYIGNRNQITDTLGNTTTLVYDPNGNVTSITDSLNNQVFLEYDTNDNLTKTTDPKGNLTTFSYDSKANLISLRDPQNQTTSFAYNSFGQLTRLTDAKGQITDFTYDSLGNLTKVTNPLGKVTTYSYDPLGRLISLTDPKNQTFSYNYDNVDHLTKITYPDTTATTYTYNCCNLTQVEDKTGTLKFTYDSLSRLKSFTNYDNQIISYDYDSEDNLITLTYPDNKKVNYSYDKDNRLIKVVDWLNNLTTYSYDTRGNLYLSTSPGLISFYQYDRLSRLTKLLNYNSTNNTITSGYEFTLDELSNRTKVKRYQPLNIPTFNLTNSSYAYNSDNQLTSASAKTFSYDPNGNLILVHQNTSTPATSFAYDYDNQLTQYTDGINNLSFQYDALGNRIKKTAGSTGTKYIIDPNRGLPSVLCETDSSGNITAYYIYGLGLISKITGSNAYFYQYDGIGSTVAITDSAGNIKNKYAYDDFGNLATNSTETLPNPFKYVGKYGVQTDLNDLLYIRARYYLPSIGRFINKDPIGLLGGLNLYRYLGNNPVNFIDPFGLLDPNGQWPFYTKEDYKRGVEKMSEAIAARNPTLPIEKASQIANEIMKEMGMGEANKLKELIKKNDEAGMEKLLKDIYDRALKKKNKTCEK